MLVMYTRVVVPTLFSSETSLESLQEDGDEGENATHYL